MTVVEKPVQYFNADWMLYILLFFFKRDVSLRCCEGLEPCFFSVCRMDEAFIKTQLRVFMCLSHVCFFKELLKQQFNILDGCSY